MSFCRDMDRALPRRTTAGMVRSMTAETDEEPKLRIRSEQEWRDEIKNMLRAELKRRDVTYEELAQKLKAIGVEETESGIRNKISRGTFPATFLYQCLDAIGVRLIPFKPDLMMSVQLAPELLQATERLDAQRLKLKG